MPALGSSRPPMSRSSVVLPLPDAPSTVTISPGATSRSIIRSASSPPKNLVTPRRRIEADTRWTVPAVALFSVRRARRVASGRLAAAPAGRALPASAGVEAALQCLREVDDVGGLLLL